MSEHRRPGQAGKHVLVEKPIGLDAEQAARLEAAVTRAKVCFMSGYSFRYIAGWEKVQELRPGLVRSCRERRVHRRRGCSSTANVG